MLWHADLWTISLLMCLKWQWQPVGFLSTATALHTGGGAEERTSPRTSGVLHYEDASLQWPWNTTGGARLHCFLHRPLRREWSLTSDGFNVFNEVQHFVDEFNWEHCYELFGWESGHNTHFNVGIIITHSYLVKSVGFWFVDKTFLGHKCLRIGHVLISMEVLLLSRGNNHRQIKFLCAQTWGINCTIKKKKTTTIMFWLILKPWIER